MKLLKVLTLTSLSVVGVASTAIIANNVLKVSDSSRWDDTIGVDDSVTKTYDELTKSI